MTMLSDLHAYVRDGLDRPVTPIRPSTRPMLPALSRVVISGNTLPTHSGPAGLVMARVQWDVWAGNDSDVDALSVQLRRLLDGFRGAMGTTDIASIFYEGERDLDEGDRHAKTYRRSLDFIVTYRESVLAEAS